MITWGGQYLTEPRLTSYTFKLLIAAALAVTVGPCITVLMYSTQPANQYIYQFFNCSKYYEQIARSSSFYGSRPQDLLIFIDKSRLTTYSTWHKRLFLQSLVTQIHCQYLLYCSSCPFIMYFLPNTKSFDENDE